MKKIVFSLFLLCTVIMFVGAQTENQKLFKEAMDSLSAKAYHHTIPILKDLIQDDFMAEGNYELLVGIYMLTDSIDNGIKYATEAHQRFPESAKFLKYNIDFYSKKGDFQNAILTIEKVLVLEPNNDMLYAFLGNLHADLKNNDKALYNYNEALKRNSKNLSAQYGIGVLYVDKSVALQKQMNELDLGDASYDTYKKDVRVLHEKAIVALEKALAIESKNTTILSTLVQLYASTENLEKFEVAKEKLKALRGY